MQLIQDALSRVSRFISRLLAIVILPGQLPGDVHELAEDLMAAPWRTIRSWPMPVVRALLRQTFRSQKLEIPNDGRLRGMGNYRQRFLGRGWVQQSVTTVDGVALDALMLEPPSCRSGERFVLFLGGNMQRCARGPPMIAPVVKSVDSLGRRAGTRTTWPTSTSTRAPRRRPVPTEQPEHLDGEQGFQGVPRGRVSCGRRH